MRVRVGLFTAAILVLVLLTSACGGGSDATTTSSAPDSTDLTSTSTTAIEALVYTAVLEGSNVVPAVKTASTGTLTLTIAPDKSKVDYVITIKGLTNLTVARLREGSFGDSGGVIVTLYGGPTKSGAFNGTLAQGSFAASEMGGPLKGKSIDDLIDLLESGQVFLNVGNSSHKGGAIAGTLEPSASSAQPTTSLASATTTSQSGGGQSTGGQGSADQALADLFGQFKESKDFSLDFKMSTSDGESTSGKMWSQGGKKMKLETAMGGETSVIIIDLVENTMIMYQPSTKQGIKTTVDVPLQDPSSYADDLDVNDAQDLGTEKVNGETCRVIQYTTSSGTGGETVTVKMWLSERLGFPVKVVTTAADGTVATVEYSNIKVGSLPGGTFDVPGDVTIISTP